MNTDKSKSAETAVASEPLARSGEATPTQGGESSFLFDDDGSTRILATSSPNEVGAALAAWVGDENPNALPLGTQLHEYSIQAVLGSGSFGITYLAHDANLHCMVAIKEYFPENLAVRRRGLDVGPAFDNERDDYNQGLARFLGETRVLASFRHHNIVRVTRFFEANATAYMVMDYEEGQPLRDWLKKHGPLGETELLRMFMPLLDGLEVVHRGGVLHRDIKPGNLYVRSEDNSLVLLDFGAARHVREGQSKSLTRIVTPGYAPFEQYHSRGVLGPWSDIYALGGVLYWLVTGKKPVEAPARAKFDDMPSALALATGKFSRPVLEAIDWALRPEEKDRPQNVDELRRAMNGGAVPAPRLDFDEPPALTRAPRQFRTTALLLGVIVLAAAGYGFWRLNGRDAPVAVATVAEAKKSEAPPAVDRFEPPPTVAPVAIAPAQPETAAKTAGSAPARKPPVKASEGTAAKAAAKSEAPASVSASAAPAKAEAPLAYVLLSVTPGGRVFVDGKQVGTAPPLQQIPVTPGKHRIAIHGSLPPGVYYFDIDLAANEKKRLRAEFAEVKY